MPQIDIHRPHAVGLAQARSVVDAAARRMHDKLGMDTDWQGDTLHFKRSGVEGTIVVAVDAVHVQARLGMLLAPLRPTIEQEIRRTLDEQFG